MAVPQIVTYPAAPILLRTARAVPRIDRRVQRLIRDMVETLHNDETGIGLAAPQVGAGQRVIVIDIGQGPIVLVNPELCAAEGEQVGLEGCLSLPGLFGEVARAAHVVVRGLDRHGQAITVEGENLLARVLQHEMDHLDGILFIARLTAPTRLWQASELQAARQEEGKSL